jgi:S1-C subfamily serine protease
MTNEELVVLQAELESRLSSTLERVQALEALTAAGRKVVAMAAESVILLQGEYGFLGPDDQPLRIVLTPAGNPLLDRNGNPVVRPDGTGAPYRNQFTGTAFLVSSGGLLLTNRHVAAPWEYDPNAIAVMRTGFRPVLHRMIGYLPNVSESFEVDLVTASTTEDLALLRCKGDLKDLRPLELGTTSVSPGDEVIVLGYPTGIRALLARTDVGFVNKLLEESKRDFWYIARRLSEEGHIAPLATRGIIGQVTPTNVVYDAVTTHGGSGGPVLSLSGQVVAVNTAILTDFGGSNLGVPVEAAHRLLERATRPPS